MPLLLALCAALLPPARGGAQEADPSPLPAKVELDLLLNKAVDLYKSEDFRGAAELIDGAIRRGFRHHRLHQIRGESRLRLSDPAGAIDDFAMAEALGGTDPLLPMGRGLASLQLKEYALALSAFRESIDQGGGAHARFGEGVALVGLNRPRESEDAFTKARKAAKAEKAARAAKAAEAEDELPDALVYKWRGNVRSYAGRPLGTLLDFVRLKRVRRREARLEAANAPPAPAPDRCRPLGLRAVGGG